MAKKLLYVITQGEWGGAQRYVFDLATNLGSEFQVIVAVGEPNGKKDLQEKIRKLQDYKIEILQLDHLVRNISPWHDFLAIIELRRLYKKLRPDIIHLNSSKAGILGSIAGYGLPARHAGASQVEGLWAKGYGKIVYTVHGWVFNEPLSTLRKKIYFYLEKFTARLKNKITVLSQADFKTAADSLKIKTDRLALVPLGIEPPSFLARDEARRELKKNISVTVPDDIPWVGTIANYYPTKGLDMLIRAVGENNHELGKARYFLIGEGDERVQLQALIENFKLEDTIFLVGKIKDAARLLKSFDMFVLPSRKEGFPYALLEARAAGIPIIATRVGGVPEIITNDSFGWMVAPNESKSLGEKIVMTLQHPPCTPLRSSTYAQSALSLPNERGGNANDTTTSLKQMLEQTTALYRSLPRWP